MTEQGKPPVKRKLTPEEIARRKAAMAAQQQAAARSTQPVPTGNPAGGDSDSSPLGSVITRNDFYRDRYRILTKIALFEAVAIVGLIVCLISFIMTMAPQTYYFATTEDGRQVPMVPLNQPNLSKPALLSWATQAATEVMTFGFNDYKRRLQEASRHFTRAGWLSFTRALQKADLVTAVTQNRQAISAAPRSAPVLLSEGPINGRYQWEVQLPMLIKTSFGQGSKSDSWDLRLIIVRVPTLESPNGVGIEQWLAFQG